MYRLGLNPAKSGNYIFMDLKAPLCLSITKNTGVVDRLTPAILSGLKTKKLILLEGELPGEEKKDTDFKSDAVQEAPVTAEPVMEKPIEELNEDGKNAGTGTEEEKEEVQVAEEPKKEAPKKPRTRKAKQEPKTESEQE